MLQDMIIVVVVPAYNEARLIASTLNSVPEYVDQIIVIDDGSNDGTSQQVGRCDDRRVSLVRHERNRGVGAAIATGYRAAFAAGADIVAVMGGDGQMDPNDLQSLLHPLLRCRADYVKGDRLSHPEARRAMPLHRWLGNHLLSMLTRWATGLPVSDSQCGYTALSRRAAARLPLDRLWSGYGYPNDLLGWLAQTGVRVEDIVVRPIYGNERSGIGWRHALWVIPGVLARVLWRRAQGLAGARSRSVAALVRPQVENRLTDKRRAPEPAALSMTEYGISQVNDRP